MFISALIMIHAALVSQPVSEETSKKRFDNYVALLNSLDQSDPCSVGKALKAYEKDIAGIKVESRDKAFVEFMKFYESACLKVTEKQTSEIDSRSRAFEERGEKMPPYERLFCPLEVQRQVEQNGMKAELGCQGDHPCFEPAQGYVLSHFGKHVSPAVQEFLRLLDPELKEDWCVDASISISWEELGTRARKWERYAEKYPESLFAKEALSLFAGYFFFFLEGMDNSRPWDEYRRSNPDPLTPETKSLVQIPLTTEAYTCFRKYIRDHPKSWSGQKVAEYMTLFPNSEQKVTWGELKKKIESISEDLIKKYPEIKSSCPQSHN